ncbi:hypothetical protein PTKIN_Ptkin10aG0158100 [Pterospermum kingtungense]
MNRRFLRKPGDGVMIYEPKSEYYTIVVHRGGYFVYTPTMKYTGKEVNYFDLCHLKAMSMIEIYDMMKELGYIPKNVTCYWKCFGGALRTESIRLLKTDFAIVNMTATIPRNRYLHLYFVTGNVSPRNGSHVEVNSDLDTDIEIMDEFMDVQVEAEVRNEGEVETEVKDAQVETEAMDVQVEIEVEAEVRGATTVDEEEEIDEEFHEPEYDMNDDDDQDYEVNIDLGLEREMGVAEGINNEMGDVSEEELEYASEDSLRTAGGSEDEEEVQIWSEFNLEFDIENPDLNKGMIFVDREILKEAIKQYARMKRYNL